MPTIDERELPCFAVQVRAGRESYVASMLESKGIWVFAPTYQRRDVRRGRGVRTTAPMFPGYIFCRINLSKRQPLLETKWVNAIVSCGRVPIPILEPELDALQRIMALGTNHHPVDFVPGQAIRLIDGPLAGVQGIVERAKDQYRLVVGITLLQRAVSAEVDRDAILPMSLAS